MAGANMANILKIAAVILPSSVVAGSFTSPTVFGGPAGLAGVQAKPKAALVNSTSNGYVVVYEHTGNSGLIEIHAFADFLNGPPYLHPHPVVVSATGLGDQLNPSVASQDAQTIAGGRALIVWQDLRNGNWDIFASRLDPLTHTVIDPTGFPIANSPADEVMPDVVMTNGINAEFVVAYERRINDQADIYARHVSIGSPSTVVPPVLGAEIAVIVAPGNQADVDLAPVYGSAWAVWEDWRFHGQTPNKTEIRGRPIFGSSTYPPTLGSEFILASSYSHELLRFPSISFSDPPSGIVAWASTYSDEVEFTTFDYTGAGITPRLSWGQAVPGSGTPLFVDTYSANSARYMVWQEGDTIQELWMSNSSGSWMPAYYAPYFTQLTSNARLLGGTPVYNGAGEPLWVDVGQEPDGDIFRSIGARSPTSVSSRPVPVPQDAAPNPAVAFTGAGFVAVWQDLRGFSRYDLFAARLDLNQATLSPGPVHVSSSVRPMQLRVAHDSKASNATTLIVYDVENSSTSARDIRARALDATGTLGPEFTISGGAGDEYSPKVVPISGASTFVGWLEEAVPGGSVHAKGRVVNHDGTLETGYSLSDPDGALDFAICLDRRYFLPDPSGMLIVVYNKPAGMGTHYHTHILDLGTSTLCCAPTWSSPLFSPTDTAIAPNCVADDSTNPDTVAMLVTYGYQYSTHSVISAASLVEPLSMSTSSIINVNSWTTGNGWTTGPWESWPVAVSTDSGAFGIVTSTDDYSGPNATWYVVVDPETATPLLSYYGSFGATQVNQFGAVGFAGAESVVVAFEVSLPFGRRGVGLSTHTNGP